MKHKKDSFRWRIYLYNIILLTMVAIMGTMYFLLNEQTIDNYNSTFTTYNELNQFYANIKSINNQYQADINTHRTSDVKEIEKTILQSDALITKIEKNLSNLTYANKFKDLHDLVNNYKQVLINPVSTNPEDLQTKSHESYLSVIKTRSSYDEIVTQDMQQHKKLVEENKTKLGWMSILLVSFMLVWIFYFSNTMIRSITNPIESIIHNINRIKKGEYDLSEISNTNEEMNVLCLTLQDMAESIQKNISYAQEKIDLEKKVLEQENDNLKKDELLAQGELRNLQNQINPHFLFNTLNMIYKKAYSEGAYETSELMEKTSQLLRYSLDNSNKISTLQEEVKALENYMYIQEKRFGERIHFILQIEPSIKTIKMPVMFLQPLVENAITHGLKDTMHDGEIAVSVKQENKEIVISVNDNGVGMPAAQLEELILNDYQINDEKRIHVGLYNITKRGKMFYGDRVHFIINSEEDCGFEIVIRIQIGDEQ